MVLPLLAIGGGTIALAGVALGGIAIATPEDVETDLTEELELTLVRTGYISEGILRGVLASGPQALVIIFLVSLSLATFTWVSCKSSGLVK